MTIELPPDVTESLGLGRHFRVASHTDAWHKLILNLGDRSQDMHILRIEDATGVHGWCFDPSMLSFFGKATITHASGIVIPQSNEGIARNGR